MNFFFLLTVDDLPSLDPELYKNLLFVKNLEGNVADLSLYFCVTEEGENFVLPFALIGQSFNLLIHLLF